MISVIIPTLDAERELAATLTALVPAAIEGIVKEVIIVDGGSSDATLEIAQEAGAKVINSARGRGLQLAKGGRAASGAWLLFLHADTIVEATWSNDARQFMVPKNQTRAAAFRFAFDDSGLRPRFVEFMVGLRANILKLPYGDQGLLIKKSFYDQLEGFREMLLMEDVEFVRRIGGHRMRILPSKAVTSATRYVEQGYTRRTFINLSCLFRYFLGVAPEKIIQTYERQRSPKNSGQ